MAFQFDVSEWILALVLIASCLGILVAKKPVNASLSFLVTLLALAGFYLELSAEFMAVMQVLVYAGAILVLFMFVIVLFQDAHQQLMLFKAKSLPILLTIAGALFIVTLLFLGRHFVDFPPSQKILTEEFGSVQSLGEVLYIDFFFPFEAVIFLFLIAIVGALYIGKKSKDEG